MKVSCFIILCLTLHMATAQETNYFKVDNLELFGAYPIGFIYETNSDSVYYFGCAETDSMSVSSFFGDRSYFGGFNVPIGDVVIRKLGMEYDTIPMLSLKDQIKPVSDLNVKKVKVKKLESYEFVLLYFWYDKRGGMKDIVLNNLKYFTQLSEEKDNKLLVIPIAVK